MCASTAAGFGRRVSSRVSADSKRRPRPTRRPERKRRTRQFVGSAPSTARVGQDDELVDACGERAELGDRRPEHGARRIDLLRHDDEPHAAGLHRARHELGHPLGVLVRGVRPLRGVRVRAVPEPLRERPVGEDPYERVGDLVRPLRIDEQPRLLGPDDVGDPAGPGADDGAPAAERLEDDPRRSLGARGEEQQPGVVERLHDLGRLEPPLPGDLVGQVAYERLGDVVVAALAHEPETRVRDARRREPPRLGDGVDVLVALEDADVERDGALGKRGDGRLGEGGQVGVRRERGCRLDPGGARRCAS